LPLYAPALGVFLVYAGTASFSISGAYIPVLAALFIFARW
jgi:hypothetical protein